MNSTLTRRQFLQTTATAAVATAGVPAVLGQATPTIAVALVGGAHIHTPGFTEIVKKRPDVKVKAVWDHDGARAARRAQELGAPVAQDLDAIWSDPEIKAVAIYSETNRHRELVAAAAQAGKHMFVEKPLGVNGKESLEMAEKIERAHLIFTTGYFMRTESKHRFVKQEVEKGHFGKITRVRGSICHSGALQGWFDGEYRWMADPKIAGVGAFGDLGTHKLDILMWMLGDVEAATADVRPVTGRFEGCDECGEGLVQFKDGVIGSIAAGWVDLEDPVQLLVSGTEGHIMLYDNHLYYRSKHVPDADPTDPYTRLPHAERAPLEQFFNAVGGAKDQPLVTPREAAARVVVMEAMYRGAREGKWMKVTTAAA